MKKLISLLLTLMLLCGSLVPALAESAAPTITLAEYKPAMEQLAKRYLDWDMAWTENDGLASGNMISNPILIVNEQGYVTMVLVGITITTEDDVETMADLFLMICTLAGAVPAVRDGQSLEAATEGVWTQMQALFSQLGTSSTAFGAIDGATAMVMMTDNPDGSVDLTMTLLYADPSIQ